MVAVRYLQACEPDALPARDGVTVEVVEPRDEFGIPRVDVTAGDRETLIAYVHENWSGEEDPQWFQEYVVDRVHEWEGT